jgi:hypothetical protein
MDWGLEKPVRLAAAAIRDHKMGWYQLVRVAQHFFTGTLLLASYVGGSGGVSGHGGGEVCRSFIS